MWPPSEESLLLRRTGDEVEARVRTKSLGDADAFGRLVVLQQRCDDTGQSQSTTIERVHKLDTLLSVTIAAAQAVGLVALEVGYRADLEPTLLCSREDLEVIVNALVKLISPPLRRRMRQGSSSFVTSVST